MPGACVGKDIRVRSLDRLKTRKWAASGRLTADDVSCLSGVTRGRHSLWRERQDVSGIVAPGQLADIDARTLPGRWTDPDTGLMLASCRHHAGKHDMELPQCLDDFPGDFDGAEGERMRAHPREKLPVSPEFSTEQRKWYAQVGLVTMDIHDMTRSLGIEPYGSLSPFLGNRHSTA